jgi:hypothetical protein
MLGSREIVIGLIAMAGVANIAVSIALVRCHFYTPLQKLAQAAIVWCVPVLGAVGIWAFLRAQYKWEKHDTRAFPEQSRKMVAVEVGNAIQDSFGGGEGGGGSD